jgi:hypothetical protein
MQRGCLNPACRATNGTTACPLYSNVTVGIMCNCNGSGPLSVQILFNADILFQQNVTSGQRSVMYNVSNPLSGMYQCIASNSYGSRQTSLFVRLTNADTETMAPTSTVFCTKTVTSTVPSYADAETMVPWTSTSSSFRAPVTLKQSPVSPSARA